MNIFMRIGMLVGLLITVNTLMGQGGPRGPRISAEEKIEKLTADLNLSEDQATKILDIEKFYDEKQKALREAIEDREIMRKEMRSMQEKKLVEINAELTEEQKVSYQELLLKQQEERGGRKGGKRGDKKTRGSGN